MRLRIACFSGSARTGSLNRQLVQAACAAATEAGAEAEFIELNDYGLPVYHGDIEASTGVPDAARALAQRLHTFPAWMISSPENNTSVSALLKNTIDWMSRIRDFDPFAGKTVALLAASPGALGGVRGLYHLRAILNTLGAEVIARQMLLPRAHQAFDANGKLLDAKQREAVRGLVRRLLEMA